MALELGFDTEKIKSAYLRLPDWQKVLITVILVLLAGGLYVYFIYMPKQQELEGLQKKLKDMKVKISESRAIADDLPRFKEESRQLNAKLEKALTQLPGSDEIPKLLKDMEAYGHEAGVQFLLFRRNPDVKKGFYAEVPVDLELSGTYHDTAVFFDRLGKLPRIINISHLSFSQPKIVEGKVLLNIKCRATTFKFISSGKEKGKGEKGRK